MKNEIFLTFDVEEWTAPFDFGINSPYNNLTEFSKTGCLELIALFDKYNIKATFFVTGYFAEREPDIVKLLAKSGHEIASHSYTNTDSLKYKALDFKKYFDLTNKILCDLIGAKVIGFRAPGFHINKEMLFLIAQSGYKYDSSVHPAIVPGRYCNWRYPLDMDYETISIQGIEEQYSIFEVPVTVIPYLRIPISWWWMRNIGNWLTYLGMDINLISGRKIILYFHPWEYSTLPDVGGLPKHILRFCGKQFLLRLEELIRKYSSNNSFKRLMDLEELVLANKLIINTA